MIYLQEFPYENKFVHSYVRNVAIILRFWKSDFINYYLKSAIFIYLILITLGMNFISFRVVPIFLQRKQNNRFTFFRVIS